MGKPTGFLEYQRNPIPDRPALERVKDWGEIHEPFDADKIQTQGRAAWTAVLLTVTQVCCLATWPVVVLSIILFPSGTT